MVAKYRAIEPGLWEHPVLRRGGFVVRDLYVYLCGHCADDEGRLRVDAYTLLEGCFSRNDPVTLDQVEAALAYLAENDLLLLYGNGDCYGFPTGWFEHQYRLDYRQPSKLPPPPTDVASWENVEVVRNEYSRQTGKKLTRSQTQVALRWKKHNNLVLVANNLVLSENVGGTACFSPKQPLEVEVEVEVKTSTARPPAHGPDLHLLPAKDPDETDAGNNGRDNGDGQRRVRGPTLTGNLAAIRKLCKSRNWPTEDMNRFLYTLRDIIGMDETKRALYVGDEDEAAGYVLQALQETYPPPAKLVTHYGRKDIIDDLLRKAEKLSAEDE